MIAEKKIQKVIHEAPAGARRPFEERLMRMPGQGIIPSCRRACSAAFWLNHT